jgi:hypothetical protein
MVLIPSSVLHSTGRVSKQRYSSVKEPLNLREIWWQSLKDAIISGVSQDIFGKVGSEAAHGEAIRR